MVIRRYFDVLAHPVSFGRGLSVRTLISRQLPPVTGALELQFLQSDSTRACVKTFN